MRSKMSKPSNTESIVGKILPALAGIPRTEDGDKKTYMLDYIKVCDLPQLTLLLQKTSTIGWNHADLDTITKVETFFRDRYVLGWYDVNTAELCGLLSTYDGALRRGTRGNIVSGIVCLNDELRHKGQYSKLTSQILLDMMIALQCEGVTARASISNPAAIGAFFKTAPFNNTTEIRRRPPPRQEIRPTIPHLTVNAPSGESLAAAHALLLQAARCGEGFGIDEFGADGRFLAKLLCEPQMYEMRDVSAPGADVVGVIVFGRSNHVRSSASRTAAGYLIVLDEFRGRRYGTAALAWMERHAVTCGYVAMTTDVYVGDHMGLDLMLSAGYSVCGTLAMCGWKEGQGLTASVLVHKMLVDDLVQATNSKL